MVSFFGGIAQEYLQIQRYVDANKLVEKWMNRYALKSWNNVMEFKMCWETLWKYVENEKRDYSSG